MLNKTGKLPFTEIIPDPADIKPLDYNDLYTMTDVVFSVEDACEYKCRKETCNYDEHICTGSSISRQILVTLECARTLCYCRYVAPNIMLVIKTPISPLTIIIAEPRLALTEFIVYILGKEQRNLTYCHFLSILIIRNHQGP